MRPSAAASGALALLLAFAALPSIDSAAAKPRSTEARGGLGDAERARVELFERVSPSVVAVSVITAADDPAKVHIGAGSGFIWDAAGHVVTNEHVVRGAGTITIWLASGEDLDAEIVGVAPNYDLAVIRPKLKHALLPAIAVGSSADLKVGQSAYVIGSPYGLDQSLTTGVISGLRRDLPMTRGREVANIIQTDAAIYPGNSGGPLLELERTADRRDQRLFSARCAQYGAGIRDPGRHRAAADSRAHRQGADTDRRHRHRARR